MRVLGLQGSPRKKGNTAYLLDAFLAEAKRLGAATRRIAPARMNIQPCKGCGFCEKNGYCVIQDDEMKAVYQRFREAEIVVAATPVYFYGFTAQLKAVIDRSQALWARKYAFRLTDPAAGFRRGFLLSMGATKGKTLFDGVRLTARYFFDAIDADYHGSLTYTGIEGANDMEKEPNLLGDVKTAAEKLLAPFTRRKRVLFVCRDNARASPMAEAFARIRWGSRIDAASAGTRPAEQASRKMVDAMAEKGIDAAFHRPRALDRAIQAHRPETIVVMGGHPEGLAIAGVRVVAWDELAAPSAPSPETMRNFMDQIEKKVRASGEI